MCESESLLIWYAFSVQRPRGEAEICPRSTKWGAPPEDRGAARPGGGRPAVSRTKGGGAAATHRGDPRPGHREAPPGRGAQEGHLWGRKGTPRVYPQKESGEWFTHILLNYNFNTYLIPPGTRIPDRSQKAGQKLYRLRFWFLDSPPAGCARGLWPGIAQCLLGSAEVRSEWKLSQHNAKSSHKTHILAFGHSMLTELVFWPIFSGLCVAHD